MRNLFVKHLVRELIILLVLLIAGTVNANFNSIEKEIELTTALNTTCTLLVSCVVIAIILSIVENFINFTRKWIKKKIDKKDEPLIYNMLRVRIFQDTGFVMPKYQDIDNYDFGRGNPLKFLVKDINWFDSYSRYKGQLLNYYSVADNRTTNVDIYSILQNKNVLIA